MRIVGHGLLEFEMDLRGYFDHLNAGPGSMVRQEPVDMWLAFRPHSNAGESWSIRAKVVPQVKDGVVALYEYQRREEIQEVVARNTTPEPTARNLLLQWLAGDADAGAVLADALEEGGNQEQANVLRWTNENVKVGLVADAVRSGKYPVRLIGN